MLLQTGLPGRPLKQRTRPGTIQPAGTISQCLLTTLPITAASRCKTSLSLLRNSCLPSGCKAPAPSSAPQTPPLVAELASWVAARLKIVAVAASRSSSSLLRSRCNSQARRGWPQSRGTAVGCQPSDWSVGRLHPAGRADGSCRGTPAQADWPLSQGWLRSHSAHARVSCDSRARLSSACAAATWAAGLPPRRCCTMAATWAAEAMGTCVQRTAGGWQVIIVDGMGDSAFRRRLPATAALQRRLSAARPPCLPEYRAQCALPCPPRSQGSAGGRSKGPSEREWCRGQAAVVAGCARSDSAGDCWAVC